LDGRISRGDEWDHLTAFFLSVEVEAEKQGRTCRISPCLVPSVEQVEMQSQAVRFLLGRTTLDLHTAPTNFVQRVFERTSEFAGRDAELAQTELPSDLNQPADTATVRKATAGTPLLRAQESLFRGLLTSNSSWSHVMTETGDYYLVRAGDEEQLKDELGDRFDGIVDGRESYFVVTGSLYHMAEASGLGNRIVSRNDALCAAATCRAEGGAKPLASLIGAFGPGTCFVFKQDWNIRSDCYAVAWSLGWFLSVVGDGAEAPLSDAA